MIRIANINDTKRIYELLIDMVNLHATIRPDIFIKDKAKYNIEELNKLIGDKNYHIYVMELDNLLIAYAICIIKYNHDKNILINKSLYIDDFCVDKLYQNQGYGTKLFNYLIEQAKKEGFDEIILNVWNGNDEAYSFYEKMGMKIKKMEMELKI